MSKQSDLRNFFGKRNAETDQEASSSSCSESAQSESSKKPAPKKDRKFLSNWLGRYKWSQLIRIHNVFCQKDRYKNDLMFCETCLKPKACWNPFAEGCKDRTPIFNDGTPIIIKVESQGPPNIQLGVKP